MFSKSLGNFNTMRLLPTGLKSIAFFQKKSMTRKLRLDHTRLTGYGSSSKQNERVSCTFLVCPLHINTTATNSDWATVDSQQTNAAYYVDRFLACKSGVLQVLLCVPMRVGNAANDRLWIRTSWHGKSIVREDRQVLRSSLQRYRR